jgi:hypothetical protein
MRRPVVVAILLLAAASAPAAERFAVIAVGDPPAGPDGDLAELTYQLRAACRDRVPNVIDPSTMRGRLLGQTSSATEAELDRAYGGALAVYQNGEFESALRTLRAIVDDLEALPESEESYFQWKRANLRLAHAALAANATKEVENAFGKLARIEPGLQPDPDQFSPGFRKRFEEVKARVRALTRRKLIVTAEGGHQGTVYVNGKAVGTTPVTVTLPTGTYRIGGAAGTLRVPSFQVELADEDRNVVLDFTLAESLRMNAGPGLALAAGSRAFGIVRAGAWLGVDRLIVVSRSQEGQAHFLVGSIYDVLRGALMREGSVRMVAGGVPSVNLSALAAFLLTGQSSREVKDLTRDPPRRVGTPVAAETPPPAPAQPAAPEPASPAPPAPASASTVAVAPPAAVSKAPPAPAPPAVKPHPDPGPELDAKPTLQPAAGNAPPLQPAAPPAEELPPGRGKSWKGPAAIGAGVLAVGLAGFALQQNIAASRDYAEAQDQLLPDGSFKNAQAQARYYDLRSEGDHARRNATISVGAAAVFGITAAVLGWNAWHAHPERGAMLTIEF